MDPKFVEQNYRYSDERGAFTSDNVNAPGPGGYFYDLGYGEKTPSRGYRFPKSKALEMIADGSLIMREGKTPRQKRYLADSKGRPVGDTWTDIWPVHSQAKERTGYPTQKPLKLLERVIKSVSNPGDLVLDPFCGCATACEAAEKLDRQWVGIDLSDLAYDLVEERLTRAAEEGGLYKFVAEGAKPHVIYREEPDFPKRNDRPEFPGGFRSRLTYAPCSTSSRRAYALYACVKCL